MEEFFHSFAITVREKKKNVVNGSFKFLPHNMSESLGLNLLCDWENRIHLIKIMQPVNCLLINPDKLSGNRPQNVNCFSIYRLIFRSQMQKHIRNNSSLFIFLASDFKVTGNDSLIDWSDV